MLNAILNCVNTSDVAVRRLTHGSLDSLAVRLKSATAFGAVYPAEH
jgi:hypothetical protein